MAKGSSESNTSSATSQYDNRVANESGVAVGAGGQYINTVSPDVTAMVSSIFSKVVDFSSDVLNTAGNITGQAIETAKTSSQGLISSNQQLQTQQQLGNAGLLTQLTPVLIIGAIGLVIFMAFKK